MGDKQHLLDPAGATVVDNFTLVGNSLGALNWNGGSEWYTGYGKCVSSQKYSIIHAEIRRRGQ